MLPRSESIKKKRGGGIKQSPSGWSRSGRHLDKIRVVARHHKYSAKILARNLKERFDLNSDEFFRFTFINHSMP